MSHDYSIELASMPSLLSLYRKILLTRKPGWDQQPLPNVYVQAKGINVADKKVRQYADVCEFDFDGKVLPPTFLYVLAFRLHATVFTHKAITFPLLGMIHLKNSISLYRPINADETFDVQCELTSSKTTDTGLEFELASKIYVGEELVWEALSTYLYRIESKGRRARPPRGSDMVWEDVLTWKLPEDLGRQYAKASGDYNLIHLHPIVSKRFGFERVLAHGMWSKARSLAALMQFIGERPFKVDVEFKLPVFMPSEVTFAFESMENGKRFEMRDIKGRRPHLLGTMTYLDK
ncbi:MaoC/PaaZ C-terminal domain-containing protein [Shewanella sp. 1_MG-2023]|uniref:MaoC family dehydratase n=1 Tax=unclassified Shewanella TaxID=196818 RepID=UPI0026E136E5|nr:MULTISPECIES: MaoC/PaaZ C-terminal domain-containing protein [unclassified Shewanella]MDO6611198.1 MaoC/PaaZ C-terminal domain-containing protein [Shewanella sp. 7_MG-2023]MDO6770925.1 MaoC/PaaZ C-terminal domain-containing protein [Shewanella sp. 2_MG-2023]MDO6794688.1 MaoC/PaaZ C-terminal domain-containing protein [Shewanella sp. 1_MG-2023]